MTRLPLPEREQAIEADATVARVYREIEQELGFGIVPNVFRAMTTHPGVLEANWHLFRAVVLKGRLPRVLKEMVGVVVSTVHESPYARQVHMHSLSVQGVSEGVLRALVDGSVEAEGLTPTTVAALRFAQIAARRPGAASEADFAALEDAGLTEEDVTELLAAVQLFTAVNLFTDVVDVELDSI